MEPLVDLADAPKTFWAIYVHTDATWKHIFVINVALDPSHQVLDISRSGHLGRPLIIFGILPKIFESTRYQYP